MSGIFELLLEEIQDPSYRSKQNLLEKACSKGDAAIDLVRSLLRFGVIGEYLYSIDRAMSSLGDGASEVRRILGAYRRENDIFYWAALWNSRKREATILGDC